MRTVFIGYDPRETDGFAVTRASLLRRHATPLVVRGLVLASLRESGAYWRPTERRDGRLWDVISGAPMSTEFAITRFLVPDICRSERIRGWVLFMDSDMLVRRSVARLFEFLERNTDKAVFVVKHQHVPSGTTKMDGQVQTSYGRKNWSSMMAINMDHPRNDLLDRQLVNSMPGRELHQFCWLANEDIGELHPEWNWLCGVSEPMDDPAIVHFTEGLPSMPGYEDQPFADEWREELHRWVR